MLIRIINLLLLFCFELHSQNLEFKPHQGITKLDYVTKYKKMKKMSKSISYDSICYSANSGTSTVNYEIISYPCQKSEVIEFEVFDHFIEHKVNLNLINHEFSSQDRLIVNLRFKGKDINVFLKYNKYVQKRDILIPKISTKQISFDGETLVLESDIDIRVLPLPSKIVNFMNSDIELLLSKNHLDIIVDNKYESFVNHLKIQTIKINKIRSKNDTEKTMKRLYEKIAIYLSHEPINYQTIVTKEKVILRHNHNLNLRRFKNINKYYKAITNLSIKKQYLEDVGLGTFTTYGYFEQLKNIVSNPIKYEMNLYDKY